MYGSTNCGSDLICLLDAFNFVDKLLLFIAWKHWIIVIKAMSFRLSEKYLDSVHQIWLSVLFEETFIPQGIIFVVSRIVFKERGYSKIFIII